MKSNNKQVKEQIKKHIFECVTNEEGEEFKTFEELKNYVWKRFEKEYNYARNKQLYSNEQQRFKEYCLGMPFDFSTWYDEQRQILNSWNLYKESATDEQTETLYFYLIYRELK